MIKYIIDKENIKMKLNFQPQGVCCQLMSVDFDGDTINSAEFFGGCSGNLQGIASLIKGMKVKDVIAKLQGIHCGDKNTSCGDQLSKFLNAYLTQKEDLQKTANK